MVSKVSKGKLNTIHVSREEMADLVDQHFIQNAETEEEYKQIWKVIKRGILFENDLYKRWKLSDALLLQPGRPQPEKKHMDL